MDGSRLDISKINAKAPSRFGWVTSGAACGPDPICDIDLARLPDFSIVPTIGSIVEGWVLVIPKQKVLSIKGLTKGQRRDLVQISHHVEHDLAVYNSPIVKLEHGPSTKGSLTGCGVDQAHLHILPLEVGFKEFVFTSDEKLDWLKVDSVDPWSEVAQDKDYYLMWIGNDCFVSYPEVKTSQYFRRKVAQFIGKPEHWDYKTAPNYENVRRTRQKFQGRWGSAIQRGILGA